MILVNSHSRVFGKDDDCNIEPNKAIRPTKARFIAQQQYNHSELLPGMEGGAGAVRRVQYSISKPSLVGEILSVCYVKIEQAMHDLDLAFSSCKSKQFSYVYALCMYALP